MNPVRLFVALYTDAHISRNLVKELQKLLLD